MSSSGLRYSGYGKKATDDKPLELVNREFKAIRPNQLWVADITYVATW